MAWEDEITSGQISYIESLMMDLSLWDKREEWFMDLVKKRSLSDFTRKDASTVITECLRMKRDKKDKENNLEFDFGVVNSSSVARYKAEDFEPVILDADFEELP